MATIETMIGEACRRFGGRPALRHKTAAGWEEISYATLWERSGRVAGLLAGHGFRPGEHAALLAPSSPQWVIAYLGILRAGGVVVPIDKELKRQELRHILLDCEARAVLSTGHWLETVCELAPDLPRLTDVLALEGGADDLPPPPVSGRRPDDIAVILYTSGTTGRSKGAMLSHANITSNVRAAVEHLNLDETIHTLSFLPISHVFEQVCGVLLPLSLGGRISFSESVKRLGENIAEVRPTFFLAVPAVYRLLLERIHKRIAESPATRLLSGVPGFRRMVAAQVRRAFGSGTIFISGGAALDPAVIAGMDRFGLTLYQGYGITETAPIISAEQPGQRRPGTVGHPLPGVLVRVDRPDDEGVGEILVKGPNVMQGYYRNPKATGEVLAGGWYRTGDLGSIDADGFLSIRGRVKNLIVTSNGKNVYPEEVEHELLKSPFIAEALVYGHRIGPAEEEVYALIHPSQTALDDYCSRQGIDCMTQLDLEELIRKEVVAACRTLADYKRVRRFTIREDEFPKTTTRKIKRFEVEAKVCATE